MLDIVVTSRTMSAKVLERMYVNAIKDRYIFVHSSKSTQRALLAELKAVAEQIVSCRKLHPENAPDASSICLWRNGRFYVSFKWTKAFWDKHYEKAVRHEVH